jgi:hypothetical protein
MAKPAMAAPTTATAMVRKITARLKLFTRLTIWLISQALKPN